MTSSIPTGNIYTPPRPLIIVRNPTKNFMSKEDEDTQIDVIVNCLSDYKDEYIFIVVGDNSIDEVQFEYPKNIELSIEELDALKVKILDK